MTESVVKEVLAQAIKELEEAGDIVIVTSINDAVINKLFTAVQDVSPNMLTPPELGGIINALYAPNLGFGLDENDFQTIIGLTKDELNIAANKLKLDAW